MPTLDYTDRKSLEELAKLPTPTNALLHTLFNSIDRVIFKKGGVYKEKALEHKIVLEISSQENIQQLTNLLEIDEAQTGFYCMCSGDYAIELYAGAILKATIGFHHGFSIRYGQWNSDAALTKSDDLLDFLAAQGLTKPLEDRLEQKRNMEADRVAARNWRQKAPACFARYWEQMNDSSQDILPSLMADLDDELPNKQTQIIALLQLFGYTKNFWTGYPVYEAVPQKILLRFDTQAIIEAYEHSDRNYKTRRGLGRFLCSFDFKKIRRKKLKYISNEVIDELIMCFRNFAQPDDLHPLEQLKKQKSKS